MYNQKFLNGKQIPVIGLGTWELLGNDCINSVKNALKIGYRHIDTAEMYMNEEKIGSVIKDYNREELFITSKLWFENYSYERAIKTCNESLKKLQTDYLDLYLLHWPMKGISFEPAIKALNQLVEEGKILSIGVSNFSIDQIEEANEYSEVPIVNNQVECHPFFRQDKLLNYCIDKGIILTAYCPLGRSKCLNHPLIIEISKKYDKSPAQICLRWQLQRKNTVVIPKSSSFERLKENFSLFNFKISTNDMKILNNIPDQERVINPEFADWD